MKWILVRKIEIFAISGFCYIEILVYLVFYKLCSICKAIFLNGLLLFKQRKASASSFFSVVEVILYF